MTEEQTEPKQHRLDVAHDIGKQLLTGKAIVCPECGERIACVEGRECVFDCTGCGMTGCIVVQKTDAEEKMVLPEQEETSVGSLTPRMVNGLLYRMLQDCDGLAVTQDFFDNMPKSLPISAQFDETNGLWQFCVRKPRARQPILKPKRKVITDV